MDGMLGLQPGTASVAKGYRYPSKPDEKVGYRYNQSSFGLLGRLPRKTDGEKGYRYPSKPVELAETGLWKDCINCSFWIPLSLA